MKPSLSTTSLPVAANAVSSVEQRRLKSHSKSEEGSNVVHGQAVANIPRTSSLPLGFSLMAVGYSDDGDLSDQHSGTSENESNSIAGGLQMGELKIRRVSSQKTASNGERKLSKTLPEEAPESDV